MTEPEAEVVLEMVDTCGHEVKIVELRSSSTAE